MLWQLQSLLVRDVVMDNIFDTLLYYPTLYADSHYSHFSEFL